MTGHVVVVDTSALIDGADETHPEWGETLRYLQGAYPVQAPQLLVSEAGNIVHHKHPEVFGQTPEERAELLEVLLTGIQRVGADRGARERCAGLVARTGLTFYDAEFLELALREDAGLLLTHDRDLHAAGREALGASRCLTLDEAGQAIAAGEL